MPIRKRISFLTTLVFYIKFKLVRSTYISGAVAPILRQRKAMCTKNSRGRCTNKDRYAQLLFLFVASDSYIVTLTQKNGDILLRMGRARGISRLGTAHSGWNT